MANVIVVDDDPVALDLVSRILAKVGDKVWKTENAQDVLALLEGPEHFDLVIFDVVLPAVSGLDLAEQIRSRHPSLPMIAISSYISSESTDITSSLRAIGVTEILRKPVDPFFLLPAVNHLLHQQQ